MASPAFTINTSATPPSKSVGAAAAVTCELVSTAGVRSCTWQVVATDETKVPGDYTLTPSGSVSQVCTTTSLTAGTAATIRATINGGIDPQTEQPSDAMSAEGKFYVPTAEGFEVGCADEQNDDNRVADDTHGMIAWLNPIVRVVSAASDFLIGPVAPSVNHEFVSFDATLDARHTERAQGITHNAAGTISLTGLTATGAVQGATVVGTTSVSATSFLAQGAAPPGAGSVRLDGVATVNAGTSVALQVAGTSVLTTSASAVSSAQPVTVTRDALVTTPTEGVVAQNTTVSTGGATLQAGPLFVSRGHGWDTDGADRIVTAEWYALPVSNSSPFARFVTGYRVDGGAFAEVCRIGPGRDGADVIGQFSIRLNAIQAIALDNGGNLYVAGSSSGGCYINPLTTLALQTGGTARLTLNSTTATFTVPIVGDGTPATAGDHRVKDGWTLKARDTAGAADRAVLTSTGGALTVGDAADTAVLTGSTLTLTAGAGGIQTDNATGDIRLEGENTLVISGDSANVDIGAGQIVAIVSGQFGASAGGAYILTSDGSTVTMVGNGSWHTQIDGAAGGARVDVGASGAKRTTVTGTVYLQDGYELSGDVTTTLAVASSPFNDHDPGTSFPTDCGVLNLDPTGGAVVIRGLKPGNPGQVVLAANGANFAVTLNHEDGAATATYRFWCPGAANYTIPTHACIWLRYDGSRWRVIGPVA
jgi:hypothetical protein